jgi:hypothetical protein
MRLLTFPAVLAAGLVLGLSPGCGGSGQNRPEIVSVFPANGAVLPGWLGCIRVTYDEPVTILNDRAAFVATADEQIPVRILSDPDDPTSVLIVTDFGGHFFPGELHHLVVSEGAVVNAGLHYAMDEFESFFTVGPASNLFVASDDGSVYEIDPATGAQVAATAPPPGYVAREPVGSDGRIWVWLDPVPGPGDSLLGHFVPGAAAIVDTVALTGETGTRVGSRLLLDPSGHRLYATARDTGTNRLRLHRVDPVALAEVGSIELSVPLSGPEPDFLPAIDLERLRMVVPFAAGATGFLAVVDLATFVEVDAGPVAGVDARPVVAGAGDAVYEPFRDVYYVLLEEEATPGFVRIDADDFDEFAAREPTLVGAPEAIFATPDALWVVQGVSGYAPATMLGLIRTEAGDLDDGFAFAVSDDVGAGPEGSTRIGVLRRDPVSAGFFAFLDDGSDTVLARIDFEDGTFEQVDLDPATPGVQGLDLSTSAPGVVTGATTLFGACGP